MGNCSCSENKVKKYIDTTVDTSDGSCASSSFSTTATIEPITRSEKILILRSACNFASPFVRGTMSFQEAEKIFDASKDKHFNYVKCSCLKMNLDSETISTFHFNKVHGKGSLEKIVKNILGDKRGKEFCE